MRGADGDSVITPRTLLGAILIRCCEEEGSAGMFADVLGVQVRTLLEIIAGDQVPTAGTCAKIGAVVGPVTPGTVLDWSLQPPDDPKPFDVRGLGGKAGSGKLTPEARHERAVKGALAKARLLPAPSRPKYSDRQPLLKEA